MLYCEAENPYEWYYGKKRLNKKFCEEESDEYFHIFECGMLCSCSKEICLNSLLNGGTK